MLVTASWEAALQKKKKNLWVLEDKKFTTSQQCVFTAQKVNNLLGCPSNLNDSIIPTENI